MNGPIVNVEQGFVLLITFWILAVMFIRFFYNKGSDFLGFLVSNRSTGLILGSISVAVAWIWAPALFVSSQKAYEQGIPGLFWFTLPNASALILFSFLSWRMRQIFESGFTLPEYMGKRFGKRMRYLYIFAIFVAQSYAVIINLTAALLLLNLITGIPRQALILILGAMMISLSLIKGIRSSFVQDSIKAFMIAVVGILIVPSAISASGGISSFTEGLGGKPGNFTNLFDPIVAWTFGVPISISLLSGVVIDQQQWQRAFALKKSVVKKSFLLGGLIFALVPLSLGLLGFISANPQNNITVAQNQLAGFYAVLSLLPKIAVLGFMFMIIAGLVAAGSAALAAISSIGAVDVYKAMRPNADNKSLLLASRISMFVLIAVGMGIALIPDIQILYLVLVLGVFRASLFLPTILSLYWSKLKENTTFWGIVLSMLTGVPLFIYGSLTKNANISSFGALVPLVITFLFCVPIGLIKKQKEFNFKSLQSSDASK